MALPAEYYLRVKYNTYRIKARDLGDACYNNPTCSVCPTGTPGTESDSNSDPVTCPPRWFYEMLLQWVYANADNPLAPPILLTLATYGPPCLSPLNDDCEIYQCIGAASLPLAEYIQARWDNYVATGDIGDPDPDDSIVPTLVVKKATLRFCGTLVSTRCENIPLCEALCDSDLFSG